MMTIRKQKENYYHSENGDDDSESGKVGERERERENGRKYPEKKIKVIFEIIE